MPMPPPPPEAALSATVRAGEGDGAGAVVEDAAAEAVAARAADVIGGGPGAAGGHVPGDGRVVQGEGAGVEGAAAVRVGTGVHERAGVHAAVKVIRRVVLAAVAGQRAGVQGHRRARGVEDAAAVGVTRAAARGRSPPRPHGRWRRLADSGGAGQRGGRRRARRCRCRRPAASPPSPPKPSTNALLPPFAARRPVAGDDGVGRGQAARAVNGAAAGIAAVAAVVTGVVEAVAALRRPPPGCRRRCSGRASGFPWCRPPRPARHRRGRRCRPGSCQRQRRPRPSPGCRSACRR